MASPSEIIELNGKRYDARTGHLLSVPKTPKPRAKKITVVHQQSHHIVHHRTERAKTLMRQTVKKPKPVSVSAKRPVVHRQPAATRLQLDPERLERAKQIGKHHAVSRFGKAAATAPIEPQIKPIITELPLQPEPVPIAPSEEISSSAQPVHQASSLFQHAIDHATSHTERPAKRASKHQRISQKFGVSPRITSLSTSVLAAVLLVGFVAYQNIPNLSMRIAAQRAGVAGRLPGYQPAGFGLSGPIEYRHGQITVQFRSHSDNRQFRLHQTASKWDSAALLKNYVAPEQASFQVRQTDGKTFYVYDDHNATWVDNGVWYEIEGDSALNNEQLLRLVASL